MIERFGEEAALLLIDVQKGVDVLEHWRQAPPKSPRANAGDRRRKTIVYRDTGGTRWLAKTVGCVSAYQRAPPASKPIEQRISVVF